MRGNAAQWSVCPNTTACQVSHCGCAGCLQRMVIINAYTADAPKTKRLEAFAVLPTQLQIRQCA
jgi:hypothetical protein